MVSRINGKFGSLDFAPVHHYHHRIEKDEYYALLTVADLALITSVRDGMNTSSYEFVVCQKDNCGPLIISEFTGTAGCLSSAVLINPWDHVGVANAINESLTLTKEEKVVRHRHLYNYIENNTAEFWASSFLKELNLQNCPLPNNSTPLLDTELVRQHYRRSTKRLILLDYDGTLSPICKTPIEAAPTNNLIAALKALCADLDNNVYVISGRDQTTLESWLGSVPLLGMSAEHGCFLKYRETSKWINLSENFDFAWKDDVYQIFEYYTERTPGSFIENKKSSITWHYRLADPDFGSWQAKECQNHLENSVLCKFALEILQGKKNLEVRPQLLSKGVTVSKLCADICPDFVFCAGDDRTDEDMFKVLRKTSGEENNSSIFTCLVGKSSRRTNAFYYLKHPFDVIKFISTLSK
jgi:trehalose-phosphatase